MPNPKRTIESKHRERSWFSRVHRTTRRNVVRVMGCRFAWLLALVWLGGGARVADAQESFVARQQDKFASTVAPLMRRYCVECHGHDTAEGDLNLELYPDYMSLLEDRARWLKLAQRVDGGDMPPRDASRPTAAERDTFLSALDSLLHEIDCAELARPGHVTIRRLNRFEYRRTILDLTGVDYEPADDFPGDDVGYGFDNIGDVLSVSPLLMEKYLAAAEFISEQAIVAHPTRDLELTLAGDELAGGTRRGGRWTGATMLARNGSLDKEIEFPADGKYEIRFRAFGDQAGDEPARMAIVVDGEALRTVDVRATERTPSTYSLRRELPAGRHRVAAQFLNDFYQPDAPDPERRDRNLIVIDVEIRGPLGGVANANLPPSHQRILFEMPEDDGRDEVHATAERLVQRLASRAYRRPATDEEVTRLTELVMLAVDEGDGLETGMQLALQAVLASPHFLFKVEAPLGPEEESRRLSDYELATSLSYFLWSSMPDDELLRSAWLGELSRPEELRRQVRRMLDDPKSAALVENFSEQWLQLRVLDGIEPDATRFPQFDESLRADMQEETKRLFADVVRGDASILTLLTADYTFVNERLARHYGLPEVRGESFQRVSLRGTGRGGLLTHASILTLTSNPTRTSPVKRGKWVLDNLLGTPPPPPAPGVLALEDQGQLSGTLRERMEQHRADPSCASCHARMDPIGFALENFDAIGQWREDDGEGAIDASGQLPDGARFIGAIELQETLATDRQDDFTKAFAEKLMTYALGRGLRYYDSCAIEEITRRAGDRDHRFDEYVLAIVESDAFQRRSRSGAIR
ncbi:MAG: DUF1592 domain-containing protein [Planctomycetales bacterium]|nr:DUF1592 domain-containing protein [Planctomycetales bacterium]